ncbi:MAG: adenylosuccinate lyase [Candidatus Omnitrophica bacterium]|nr:adenylosuccinate lyase [Candidatus Omnitrophota bacterium]MCM8777268.1 adenylosuccinate lyase [Candidatus Omnitrophota bacterium]
MIPRYTRKEMAEIWSEENKFRKWLDVEIAALEGWNSIGVIPDKAVEDIKNKVKIDVEKIQEIEKLTNHDVIAFVEQISSSVGENGRYIHYGLTSSDILDTSLALLLRESGNLILKDIEALIRTLKERVFKLKDVVMMGRTHGVHAEPITLGFKFAGWYYEFLRNYKRMEQAIEEISIGKLSGAVGTFSNIDPRVEEYVCKKLSLEQERFSTQIISRDRHCYFLGVLGIIASSCEKVALQIRLMQQTEVGELAEPFGKGQKGSSAMPHKRNPILCERVCGLARVIKKNVSIALENVALWYERDISHSSAERIIFPESLILLDYILTLLNKIVSGLDVFEENIEKNLNLTGRVFFSQRLLNALAMKGLPREKAYEMVQKKAFETIEKKDDFVRIIKSSPEIKRYFTDEELEDIFDMKQLFKNINKLFDNLK